MTPEMGLRMSEKQRRGQGQELFRKYFFCNKSKESGTEEKAESADNNALFRSHISYIF